MASKAVPIQIKRSTVAGRVPSSLLAGELAINLTDKKLFGSTGSGAFQVAPSMAEHLSGKGIDFYNQSRKIDIVAGVIRQSSTDRSQWAFLDDGVHTPVGFDSDPDFFASDGTTRLNPNSSGVSLLLQWKIRTDALRANVASAVAYKGVLACTATPDERLTYDWGIQLGAKVTRTGLIINGSMHKTRVGRIHWGGSDFVAAQDGMHPTGDVTTSWDSTNGVLTVNHGWLPGQDLVVAPDTRNGAVPTMWLPVRESVTDTSFQVRFLIPNTGAYRTGNAGSGMSFRWTKRYSGPAYFNGQNGWDNVPWSDADSGNIWIYGIMERE